MIPIKNSEAIKRMRESCAIAATVLSKLKEQVRPGITTYDLDQIGRDLIAGFGARSACYGYQLHSRRYPAYTCLSVNEEVVHGIGSLKRILRDGDIIRLDARAGVLEVQVDAATLAARQVIKPEVMDTAYGVGRELFTRLREGATPADEGASIL